VSSTPVDRGVHEVHEVAAQAQQHRLRLRVAEAHVVFDHLRRARRVDHQAGVEESGEWHAVGDHAAHGRLDHLAQHARMHLGRDHRRRRVGAHAAGVRPVSPSPTRLWSCEVAIGSACSPSTIEMKLASSPSRNSSMTTREPAAPKALPAEHVADRGLRLVQRHRHDDALARGQAVGLHHDRRADVAHVLQRQRDIVEHLVVGGRDAVPREEILGEGLAALELRGGARRPEDALPRGAKHVNDAADQRALRPDHGQRDLLVERELQQPCDIGRP
jgi:hypothetical protein